MYNNFFYRALPAFCQNVIISMFGLLRIFLREGKESKELELQLLENERSEEKLNSFRSEALAGALNNARFNVPYYKGKRADVNDFSFIDKIEVQRNWRSFINENHRGLVIKGSTSGTSGSPLSILQSKNSVSYERAFANRQRKWAGYKKGDKRAWLRGDLAVPANRDKPPYWRYSYFEDMIILSTFHISYSTYKLYIDAMVKYGVSIIQAYPSSIAMLAGFLEKDGEYYPDEIKSILTSSENLSPEDRALIERRFKCKVYDWYGLFERVAAIGTCEYGRYHLLTDYSYVELLDNDDGLFEIVGTNFNNHYQPLIRYRTGDHITLSKDKCCPCGRVYPVVESIHGRNVDFLYGENGKKVYAIGECVKGVSGILGSQYFQKNLGEVFVNIVPGSDFDETQSKKLVSNVKRRLGDSISVEIVYVNSLIRTNSGKVRRVIREV